MREELMPTRYISYCSHWGSCRRGLRRSPGPRRLPMMLSSTMKEELMPTRYISYCSHRARCRLDWRSPDPRRLLMMLSSTMREELMPTRYVSSCGYGGVGRCKGDHPPCSYQRIKILVLTSPSKVTSVCFQLKVCSIKYISPWNIIFTVCDKF